MRGYDDFDEYVFQQLENGHLTSAQATVLWEYTDGYQAVLTSTLATASTYGIHCLKKTHSVIQQGEYDTGAICFST